MDIQQKIEKELDFKVIGWNASYSDASGGTSCSAITLHNKDVYLLDCGFGALAGMFKAKVNPTRVKGIFITHTHLDHVGGIPELQWFLENQGINRVLDIVMPLGYLPHLPRPVNYVDTMLDAEIIPLQHRIVTQGYRFGDSLAYITDTRPSMDVVEAVRGVKLLYHEATYGFGGEIKAKKWYHSTSVQAAMIALEADVEKLIIGHFSHSVNPSTLLEEARRIFKETYLPF